jgi:hypothetical protein
MVGIVAGNVGTTVVTFAALIEPEVLYSIRGEFYEDVRLRHDSPHHVSAISVCSGEAVAHDCAHHQEIRSWSSTAPSVWQPWRWNFVRFHSGDHYATVVLKLHGDNTAERDPLSVHCATVHITSSH